MAAAIRSYMDERITAFQFDDALDKIGDGTKDETVSIVGQALWFHYDDIKDHHIVATKEEWAYFNRLLLLLESDGEMEVVKKPRRWHFTQSVAAVSLIYFAVVAIQTGWGLHLYAYAVPLGMVSLVLEWVNSLQTRKATSAIEGALTPFPSIRSLFSIRRQVAGFSKSKYPDALANRSIRGPIEDKLMWIRWTVMGLMFSPVALFFQMLPKAESETRIRMPAESAA